MVLSFYNTCQSGDMDKVLLMIDNQSKFSLNDGLMGACENGNKELISLLIAKGANKWDRGLVGACSGGHLDIAKDMIDRGAKNLHLGLYQAYLYDNKEITFLLVLNGADIDTTSSLTFDDIQYLYTKGVRSYSWKYGDWFKQCKDIKLLFVKTLQELSILNDMTKIIIEF